MQKILIILIALFQTFTKAADLVQGNTPLIPYQLFTTSGFAGQESGTGSLVQFGDDVYVLTAAHCVKTESSKITINIRLKDKNIIRTEDVSCLQLTTINNDFVIKVKKDDVFIPALYSKQEDEEKLEICDDFSLIKLLADAEFDKNNALKLVTSAELELLKKNLSHIKFCVPITFCGTEEYFLNRYNSKEKKIVKNGHSLAFVFDGRDCAVSGDFIEVPPCTTNGNSGSPLVVLSVDHKKRPDLQNLVGKVFGVCSNGNERLGIGSNLKYQTMYSSMLATLPFIVGCYSYFKGYKKLGYGCGILSASSFLPLLGIYFKGYEMRILSSYFHLVSGERLEALLNGEKQPL
ncbi:MAG: trypsin-like serine protease [Proteobacteria bacterium]|nr:trypsin-like serine protease [Pseudomonadota bacterium]